MRRRLRYTATARNDIDSIAHYLEIVRGLGKEEAFLSLLAAAFALIAEDPQHVASRPVEDAPWKGTRRLHLRHARKRARASHLVFYRLGDDDEVLILRVLHDRSDLPTRLGETELA